MMSELTPRQSIFVKEYLVDLNGTAAAIRAGYSQKTARQMASQNLAKLNISHAIQEGFRKRQERLDIDQDWVIGRLKDNHDKAAQAVALLDKHGEPTGTYTFQGSVANRSLELIGRHLGMFQEKLKVGDPMPEESDDFPDERPQPKDPKLRLPLDQLKKAATWIESVCYELNFPVPVELVAWCRGEGWEEMGH
tara:strand:- start:86 stop:664 length:579 start_codon:yes stop_codon:yes gene_type:complete